MTGDSARTVGRTAATFLGAGLALAVVAFGAPGPNAGAAGEMAPPSAPDDASRDPPAVPGAGACAAAPHRVELQGTGRAPGASGWMDLRFGSAPFDVSVTEDGSYRYRVSVHVTSVPPNAGGELVAWAATPELDRHVNLGPVGEDGVVEGEISWNKFLVFVTAESDPDVERWQGPILMTGTSPSGNMHTMAGHGIFEQHGIGC